METPKVYIETTLFNFYFARTRGQYYGKTVGYCRDARLFFEAAREGYFEPYTSEHVMDEIKAYGDEKQRDEMLKLIADCGVRLLPFDERVGILADLYIEATAVPAKYRDDAVHIASTAVHGLDFIVSLNFEHIVKDKAIRISGMINEAEGYERVGIYEPGEVIGHDDD